jgi:hypothetical protein
MYRRTLLNIIVAATVCALIATSAQATVVLPNADAFVSTEINQDGNHGTESALLIKNAAAGDNNDPGAQRKAYIRFDLSSLGTDLVSQSALKLHVSQSLGQGFHDNVIGKMIGFSIYGLNDGDAGESWDETLITWYNAPQNDQTSGSGLLPNTTHLGSFDLFETGIGTDVDFSSPALTSFLNDDTNDLLTLIVVRDFFDPNVSGYVHQFYSREAGDELSPSLEVNVVPEPASIAVWSCLGLTAASLQWRRSWRYSRQLKAGSR